MKSDYPFPNKCEKCIHNGVCYMVGECLNYIPDFECDCFEEKRPHGKWVKTDDDLKISDYMCSVCGQLTDLDEPWNFCPNCGSDNRKGASK